MKKSEYLWKRDGEKMVYVGDVIAEISIRPTGLYCWHVKSECGKVFGEGKCDEFYAAIHRAEEEIGKVGV